LYISPRAAKIHQIVLVYVSVLEKSKKTKREENASQFGPPVE
jgi:hypothetical protein